MQKKAHENRIYTLYTAALATAMLLLLFILMGYYPFGDTMVLTGDLNGQYIPYFRHFRDALLGNAGFTYGLDKALGGGLLGIFSYYVASPFNLLYLLVSPQGFPGVASLLLFIKLLLASVFFNFFIGRKYPTIGWVGVALSVCYGFISFNFAYAQNIMWHDVMLLLPLLCYGIDRILQGRRSTFYIVVLAIAVFANFYIAYMACIFLVLYFVYSMVCQKATLQQWKRNSLVFAGSSIVGAGLTAALLLPSLADINSTKGDLFSYSFSAQPNFPLWRFVRQLVWGNLKWADVEAGGPQLYCGILALVLLVCFFASRKIELRQKLAGGGILVFFVLSFYISGLDVIWHGLKPAVWFPFRNSYLFCFFVLLLAATAFAKGAVGLKQLLLACGLLGVFYAVMLLMPQEVRRLKTLLSIAAVIGFAVLLYCMGKAPKKWMKTAATVVLVGAVALEMSLSGFGISRQFERYPYSTYVSFLQEAGGTVQTVEMLYGEPEKGTTYRIEKNFFRGLNDTMLLDYAGLSHFGSTQDDATVDVMSHLGWRGYSFYGYGSTAFSESVLGIRYLFANEDRPLAAHWQLDEAASQSTAYPVYTNPTALPLAFAVPNGSATEVDAVNSFAYQNELYRILSGKNEELLHPVKDVVLGYNGQQLPLAGTVPSGSAYKLTAQEAGYYYALAVAPEGYPLYHVQSIVNGQAKGPYFAADNGGVINLGWYEGGEEITLSWEQAGDIVLSDMFFYYLPPAKLQALADVANANSGNFVIKDGNITGSIVADEDEMLFLSIPYNQNWVATVNGQEVEPQELMGGLMTLPLQQGENQITMRYKAKLVGAGWAVTGVFAALFVAMQVVHVCKKKKTQKKG